MTARGSSWRRLTLLAGIVFLLFPHLVVAADQPALSKEQITHFLLTAKVVNSKRKARAVKSTSYRTAARQARFRNSGNVPGSMRRT